MPDITPKFGAWFNFAALILSAIGAGTIVLAGLPDATNTLIKTWALNGVVVLAAANLVFHLYSAPVGGPLAK